MQQLITGLLLVV